jgi:hypothetical protein
MAAVFRASGLFPDIESEAAAFVKMQIGRELGCLPMESMLGIHMIPAGANRPAKPMLSADLMGALCARSDKYEYRIVELTNERCEIHFFSTNMPGKPKPIGISEFTMKDAQMAGLANKDNYKKYPRNMLRARAVTNGVKNFCPDLFMATGFAVESMAPESQADSTIIEPAPVDGLLNRPGAVETKTWGPEGPPGDPWSTFWAELRIEAPVAERNDKVLLHAFAHKIYGVEETVGSLKAKFEAVAVHADVSLAYVIALETTKIRERVRQWNLDVQNSEYDRGGPASPEVQPMLAQTEADATSTERAVEQDPVEEVEGATA